MIVGPAPELAPVIGPVIVPIVHEKLLVGEAARLITGAKPLQMVAVLAVVTNGAGLTVTIIE